MTVPDRRFGRVEIGRAVFFPFAFSNSNPYPIAFCWKTLGNFWQKLGRTLVKCFLTLFFVPVIFVPILSVLLFQPLLILTLRGARTDVVGSRLVVLEECATAVPLPLFLIVDRVNEK